MFHWQNVASISIFECSRKLEGQPNLGYSGFRVSPKRSTRKKRRGAVWMGISWCSCCCYCLEIVSRHGEPLRRWYASMRRGRDWRASRREREKGEPVDSKLGCHDARISVEKRKDFRIVALHTERPILFSRFEMWVAVRLYVGIVVSLFSFFFFVYSLSLSFLASLDPFCARWSPVDISRFQRGLSLPAIFIHENSPPFDDARG